VRKKLFVPACAFVFVAAYQSSLLAQAGASAQQSSETTADARPSEPRVPLAQAASAFDVEGHEALGARLRTQTLAGTTDAPVRNTRIVVENRSPVFYNYVAGWATFYGEDGVRCGEGLWKLEALAPQEQVEVDTPGIRLTCAPATWRVVATTLLTRTGDVAKPQQQTAPPPAETGSGQSNAAAAATRPADSGAASSTTGAASNATGGVLTGAVVPPLEINVNGKTIPLQLGNPLEIQVGKERVRIVVQQAP
jgi:hypothetical protein